MMNTHINYISERPHSSANAEVLWVPSEDVVVRRIARPTAPKRKWSALIPWLLEDQLLQSVESMHFVTVEQNDGSELDVLTVSKQVLQQWLSIANNAQMVGFSILPDFLALPWENDSISVVQRDELLLVRYGFCRGFALPPDMAWVLIADLLEESNGKLKLLSGVPVEQVPKGLFVDVNSFIWRMNWHSSTPNDPLLSKKLVSSANLLVGEFYQRPSKANLLKRLSSVAAVIVLLVFSLLYIGFSNQKISAQVEGLEEEKAALFSTLFPSLRYRARDAHINIEALLGQMFKQRESLQMPTMALLAKLDEMLLNCECDVHSVRLNEQGGELLIANGSAQKLAEFTSPEFEIIIKPAVGNSKLLFILKWREL